MLKNALKFVVKFYGFVLQILIAYPCLLYMIWRVYQISNVRIFGIFKNALLLNGLHSQCKEMTQVEPQ